MFKTHSLSYAQFASTLVERGEEVIIARAGQPVMKLVRIEPVQKPLVAGFASDLLAGWADVDWQALDNEVNELFKDA